MKDTDPINAQYLLDLNLTEEMTLEQAEWLISISRFVELQDGEHLADPGDKIEHTHIILEGMLEVYNSVGGQFLLMARYEKGGVTGLLPYSRMTHVQGKARAEGYTRLMLLPKSCFPEMAKRAPALIQRLVEIMLDRTRDSTRTEQQREKMISLGKISAGFAHELNNPASAINRAATTLKDAFDKAVETLEKTGESGLNKDAWYRLRVLLDEIDHGEKEDLSVLERSDEEDRLEDLFEDWGIENSYAMADELVEMGLKAEDVDLLAGEANKEALPEAIGLLTQLATLQATIKEVKNASVKISDLIASVKSYSHMDRSPEMELMNIEEGINHTLTILSNQLHEKDIQLDLQYDKSLPKLKVYVSELNQVWTNLLDNAVDAMEPGGRIIIETTDKGEFIHVNIKDEGRGIAPEIRSKIFDPFFTTKNTGAQGLGLDIALRIVRLHKGDITVESRKGETCFTVCLPKEIKT
ncbi:ATP-binding protein [Roseivirga sp. BDSF3-8]|uniref:ATP-binding protein n=1 Tax=Roseivirga sp. BDSF3-8 TaxID=3241598 RepID=UPI003531FE02